MNSKLINNTVLSKKYNKTVPQIILKWDLQKNIMIVPKSGHKQRFYYDRNRTRFVND